MNKWNQLKDWIKQNAPMLAVLYENKYIGMLYDRFGSLPPKQQRQVIIGSGIGLMAFVGLLVLTTYLSYWTSAAKAEKAGAMVNMLLQYQTTRRGQEAQIQNLERNNQLAAPDALKNLIVEEAKGANISPRMVKAEEKSEASEEESKGGQEVKLKQATVKLERVNLTQLHSFLQNIEFGPYNLSISSLKISNDDQLRGYMNVEMGVVAYLFQAEDEGT